MNKQTLRQVVIGGLFLVPFVSFFVSGSLFFPYVTTKAFLFRAIVEAVFGAWLVLALTVPEYRPKKSLLLYAVLGFLLVVGLADFLGVEPVRSFWSNFERMDGYVSLLHLGAYFLVASTVLTAELWQKWWKTELVASALMAGYGLLQLIGAARIAQGGARVDGTFGNAAYLAVYMLFNIFIAAVFLAREWKKVGARYAYSALIVLQTVILYYTATRGAILGLLGGVIIFAILSLWNREERRVKKLSALLLIGVFVLVGGFVLMRNTNFVRESPVLARFASLDLSELRSQGRYFVWPMAWQGFLERPVLGWGQENFMYVFQEHYRPEMYRLEPWFDRAHNIFLDWLVAGGALGLLGYLSLYVAALYLTWKKGNLSHTEKALITALLSAYFFHNFFVFDHLASYVLFFSLLAYVQYKNGGEGRISLPLVKPSAEKVLVGAVLLLTLFVLYIVNGKPIASDAALLSGLRNVQVGQNFVAAAHDFERAYGAPTGKMEVMEQSINSAVAILQSPISVEEKNQFYNAVKGMIENVGKTRAEDARYELAAGSFYASVGDLDQGLAYLNEAKRLMPEKQQVYFELGSAYINKKDYAQAMAAFKQAYELAPAYTEAQIIYLIGAIYAGDASVEQSMLNILSRETVTFDDRVAAAYYAKGRLERVRAIIAARKELDPQNAATYDAYLEQLK